MSDTTQNIQIGSLKKRADFLWLAAQNKKWVTKGFILQLSAAQDLNKTRFGLTVSKKTSKKAVVRNRIKRRLRALSRDVMATHELSGKIDYVLIGRKDAYDLSYEILKRDFLWALRKLKETHDL